MDFQELEGRFLDEVRRRIRSGELTERKLARMTGISQPHIHNVLKGRRLISIELADTILQVMRMDLLDLVTPEERASLAARE